MIQIRKAEDRGSSTIGWLESYHTFSFGQYYDPDNMHFGYLRVINEDKIKPSGGFGTHPHRDMEIITVMIDGQLAHKDSMGNGYVIKKGDIQKMTAGSGIMHSEFNASDTKDAHLLQIWITPNKMGLEPGYEQISLDNLGSFEQIKLIASAYGDTRKGIIKINQNVDLFIGNLASGKKIEFISTESNKIWVQMISGELSINNIEMKSGDGAAITDNSKLEIKTKKESQFLIFEMK